MSEQRWLVTGAGGFIGSRVCRLLAKRGEDFIGTLLPKQEPPSNDNPWPVDCFRPIDLRDGNSIEKVLREVEPTFILNLAAIGVVWTGQESLDDLIRINVILPGLLAQRMGEHSILIQAGSQYQYLSSPTPLEEDTSPLVGGDPYCWSKIAVEGLLGVLKSRAVIRTRIFATAGPNEPPSRLLPGIVRAWATGTTVALTDCAQIRDLLHVDDVAAALVSLAIDRSLAGSVVNIGRGEGRSVRWMAEHAANRLGCIQLLQFGARARRTGEGEHLVANVSRLRSIGFEPQRTIEQSVDDVVDELARQFRVAQV